jgi:hypothetical protein
MELGKEKEKENSKQQSNSRWNFYQKNVIL